MHTYGPGPRLQHAVRDRQLHLLWVTLLRADPPGLCKNHLRCRDLALLYESESN